MSGLLRFAIERTQRGIDPAQTITAPLPDHEFGGDPDKGLLDQRDRYFEQSKNTRDGEVAPYRKVS